MSARPASSSIVTVLLALALACGGAPGPADAPDGDAPALDTQGGDTEDVPGDDVPPPDALADALEDVADAAPPDAEPDTPDTLGTSEPEVGSDVATLDETSDSADADPGPPEPWRSALYPETWTPDHTGPDGRFLHDFSYAGWRNGADGEPMVTPGFVADVTTFGADPTGAADATAAIQAAIDAASAAAAPGAHGVVHFPEGTYHVAGTLKVAASWVVLRGDGPDASRLVFAKTDGMSFKPHLQIGAVPKHGADLPLAVDAAARAFTVEVADASALAPGDDVALGWTITPEFVADHGMTGTWSAFNGSWQPFFRRTVVAVDTTAAPHRVTLDVPLRYPALVRDGASLRPETGLLREVGVESLGLANAASWEAAWDLSQVHALALLGVTDAWVRDVASFPSPLAPASGEGSGDHLLSGGLIVAHAKRVTVADTSLGFAQNRGSGGNGYLFEVRQSSEVLFRDCDARAGRHNFIQNWGFGTSGVVWLRVFTADGKALNASGIAVTGLSEFHHSLAMANLIDSSVLDDGWGALNRKDYSSGAGHTSTATAFWNSSGSGLIRSYQYGHGYVIGTAASLAVATVPEPPLPGLTEEEAALLDSLAPWYGAAPDDWTEGLGLGPALIPPSLYEDQLARRLAAPAP